MAFLLIYADSAQVMIALVEISKNIIGIYLDKINIFMSKLICSKLNDKTFMKLSRLTLGTLLNKG